MIVAVTSLACFAANLAISRANLGRATQASEEFCKNIENRIALAQTIEAPKILLIGGSSVRRGLSARILSEKLSTNVFNFGLQAALGPELTLSLARRVLRPGDTAVLALEYSQYAFTRWNEVALDAIFGCFTELYEQASILDWIEMAMTLPPWRLWETWTPEVTGNDRPGSMLKETLPEPVAAIAHGDIPLHPAWSQPISDFERRRLELYRPMRINFVPDSRGTKAIVEFVNWARANDVKVAMTWPNTIAFSTYDGLPALAQIADFYRRLGVPIIGEPSLGFYPRHYFYDTQYHMAPDGVRKRTDDFLNAIDPIYRQMLTPIQKEGQLSTENRERQSAIKQQASGYPDILSKLHSP